MAQERLFYAARHLAERFNVSTDQVRYAIDRKKILPLGRAGAARIFDAAQAEEIGRALAEIAEGPVGRGKRAAIAREQIQGSAR